jgi:hypothetical protein
MAFLEEPVELECADIATYERADEHGHETKPYPGSQGEERTSATGDNKRAESCTDEKI